MTKAVPPIASRRRLCLAAGIALAVPAIGAARPARATTSAARNLAFEHTHTGEKIALDYAVGGAYSPEALATLAHFLRDFRTGDSHPIDPRLFDQLHALARLTGTRKPFQVISAYRSPATNDQLRSRSRGVASHSLHLDGRAIDIRLADIRLADLRDAAISLQCGGVGCYFDSDFVHVDTGRVRRW